jgi:hypothetical protein
VENAGVMEDVLLVIDEDAIIQVEDNASKMAFIKPPASPGLLCDEEEQAAVIRLSNHFAMEKVIRSILFLKSVNKKLCTAGISHSP